MSYIFFTFKRCSVLFTLLGICFPASLALADYKDSTGYSDLELYLQSLGEEIPDGSGVRVTQVEASANRNESPAYLPTAESSEFAGKTLTDLSKSGNASNHSTRVASYFFGNISSMTPGITQIDAYEANDFLIDHGWANSITPPVETNQVQNHSWVAQEIADHFETPLQNLIMDFAIQRDDFLLVAGVNNGAENEIPDLYAHLCNGLSVGRADGDHSSGLTQDIYLPGRTKPEIVSDADATSHATPQVSSAASLIYDLADGEIDHRAVKAILLAGANKYPFPEWDQKISRPLDDTFGAGLLDVFASYTIHQAGMQQAGHLDDHYGWNINTLDGNEVDTYTFTVPEGFELRNLSILVTWDIDVSILEDQRLIRGTLADLALHLNKGEESLQISDSMVDNVEHIWRDRTKGLKAGEYSFTVSTDKAVEYAIAWRGDLHQKTGSWANFAPLPTKTKPTTRASSSNAAPHRGSLEYTIIRDSERRTLGVTPVQTSGSSSSE